MSTLTLTEDQQSAYDAFCDFLFDPNDNIFVLEGYSGTGKSTLVEKLVNDLPKIAEMRKIINPSVKHWDVKLTATTNKAAENLSFITGWDVSTIHSLLQLRVYTDYKSGKTSIGTTPRSEAVYDTIIFIDEASYIDETLLKLIRRQTKDCKIVFIGDPAQLLTVGCDRSPVFDAGFTTAKLQKVVRQAEGSPITQLATLLRETVNTGEFFKFKPDGKAIQHLPRGDFEDAIIDEFGRMEWRHRDSKVLAWTNKCVTDFNANIREHVAGNPEFTIGDYAICNRYVTNKMGNLKTDQLVHITGITPGTRHGVVGKYFEVDKVIEIFMPDCRVEWQNALKRAQDKDQIAVAKEMMDEWADLRAAYSCTINKSQGSTYDKVFIDLDDVGRCRDPNQLARMLYVGISRARNNVFLTGDI